MSIIDVYYLCNGMDIITFIAKINENEYRDIDWNSFSYNVL